MKNLFIALAVLVAVGCTKSETEQSNKDIYNVTPSWRDVLQNTEQSLQLSFNATTNWDIEVSDESKSWISLTPSSGNSGLNRVLVNIKRNPYQEERVGNFSIIPLMGDAYIVLVRQKKTDFDASEQQRIETILTSHYWQISESIIPGYNSERERSLIYWYKENGELWVGYDYDFINSTHKAATWTLAENNLAETWPHLNKTFTQDITFISDEKLIFADYGYDTLCTRTYIPVVIK